MVDPQSLAPLGLTAYESAAYITLLGRPELTPADVAARAKIPRQRVYDVLASLAAKGLCLAQDTNPKTFRAVEPRAALDLLVLEREAALERQRREARDLAERLGEALGPVFAFGHGQNDPLAYVEVLSGAARIAQRALDLARAARFAVNSCVRPPMILSPEQNRAFMESPLGRGLRYRALLDAPSAADPALREWIGGFARQGMDIRVVETLPLKMQAFDDRVVLLSMQDPAAGQPSFTAVQIHNAGAVAMLNLAFEHLWDGAEPYAE